ncbi:ASKHA domain-containing protein [Paracoccaceae bacterium]|nr:ASKHA domain-containing protein [Paracoccaceae bacterium]
MENKNSLATILFTPSGIRGRVKKGTTILEAAQKLSVDLNSICGARGRCSKCQVEPTFGEFNKLNIRSKETSVSEKNETEFIYRKKFHLSEERRLGCQTKILGDLVVDVPEDSQIHKQIIKKETNLRDFSLNTSVKAFYVQVSEPQLDSLESDFERLRISLKNDWNIQEVTCSVHVLKGLQEKLRSGNWEITVLLYFKENTIPEIVDIHSGYSEIPTFGLAIDLGSTSIAATLCDLNSGKIIGSMGIMNPQIRYGEDVMSRVSYCMMDEKGLATLNHSVIEGVNELTRKITEKHEIKLDSVFEIVFVANPIMHHLLLGIDPKELGQAPFPLVFSDSLNIKSKDIGLILNSESYVYTVPCIGGHVGADAASVLIAEQPQKLKDTNTLLIDIGTNAEILLAKGEEIFACSCPTGPALEGAQISAGQRAAPGAIERVRIDPITKEPSFKVIGCEQWSNEKEFSENVSGIGVTGICGSGIIEAVAEMRLAGLLDANGLIGSAAQTGSKRCTSSERTNSYLLYSDNKVSLSITNMDIRAIQLAKAALHASFKILLEKSRVNRIDNIFLAGAFGSQISPEHALIIGLVPDAQVSQIVASGNSAGAGAIIALLDVSSRREISSLVRKVHKIETAVEPSFQKHFVEGSSFPNDSSTHPELFKFKELPNVNFNQKRQRRHR